MSAAESKIQTLKELLGMTEQVSNGTPTTQNPFPGFSSVPTITGTDRDKIKVSLVKLVLALPEADVIATVAAAMATV